MERTVLYLDSIDLDDAERAADALADSIDILDDPLVVVTPAFEGLAGRSPAAATERLRERHLAIARALGAPTAALEAASLRIDALLVRGLCPSLEADLAATCAALAFVALGRPAALVAPHERAFAELARFPAAVLPGDRGLAAHVAKALGARLIDANAALGLASSTYTSSTYAASRLTLLRKIAAPRPGAA
jgi:hypothetical protein